MIEAALQSAKAGRLPVMIFKDGQHCAQMRKQYEAQFLQRGEAAVFLEYRDSQVYFDFLKMRPKYLRRDVEEFFIDHACIEQHFSPQMKEMHRWDEERDNG